MVFVEQGSGFYCMNACLLCTGTRDLVLSLIKLFSDEYCSLSRISYETKYPRGCRTFLCEQSRVQLPALLLLNERSPDKVSKQDMGIPYPSILQLFW